MKLHKTLKRLGIESLADGTTRKEIEFVYYGKIVNPEQLAKATEVEHQEQWELRTEKDDGLEYFGSVRVRKSWVEGVVKPIDYTLTIKTLKGDGEGKDEVEMRITPDVFEQIKRLATGGMTKARHRFPIEGTDYCWEVDVYYRQDGSAVEWCKVDLEVQDSNFEPPAFPIELSDALTTQPEHRTDEQREFVRKLMDEHFVLPNAFKKA